jgi:hypothetical protein
MKKRIENKELLLKKKKIKNISNFKDDNEENCIILINESTQSFSQTGNKSLSKTQSKSQTKIYKSKTKLNMEDDYTFFDESFNESCTKEINEENLVTPKKISKKNLKVKKASPKSKGSNKNQIKSPQNKSMETKKEIKKVYQLRNRNISNLKYDPDDIFNFK